MQELVFRPISNLSRLPAMSAEPGAPRQRWRRRIAAVAVRAALLLFVLGLIIRLTIRDRILVANTIYHATPGSVLCVLGAVSAYWARTRFGRRGAAVIATAAIGCGAMWCWTAWSFRSPPDDLPGVRVVTWNLSHGHWGLEGLAAAAAK